MNNQQLVIIFAIVSVVAYLWFIYQNKRKAAVYKFYRLRDNLYRMAIEGQIDENTVSFKTLSMMLNVTISNAKELKLKRFIKLLEEKKIDKPDQNEKFFIDLQHQDIAIRNLANTFFSDFVHLLYINHPFLYLVIHIKLVVLLFPQVKKPVQTAYSYRNSKAKLSFAA